MTCNCINEMDAVLSPHNTKLQVTFSFNRDGSSWTFPLLGTEKIEKRVRKGPALAIPTFCPFCGTRYIDDIASVPEPGVLESSGRARREPQHRP